MMIVSRDSMVKSSGPISKTENSWKVYYSSPSNLTIGAESQSVSEEAREIVQGLVQELADVDGMHNVRAIAPMSVDMHWIEFELELQAETELSHELWDNIQDLIIDCEWELRDKTNEKWYFHAQIVEKLGRTRDSAKVIATSYQIPKSLNTTWSSYNKSKIQGQYLF